MAYSDNFELISHQFYNADQSWNFEKIINVGKAKLRIHIRRNSANHQSFVRGYLFGNSQWNLIVDRPIETAACKSVSYVNPEKTVKKELFELDFESVFFELIKIIC